MQKGKRSRKKEIVNRSREESKPSNSTSLSPSPLFETATPCLKHDVFVVPLGEIHNNPALLQMEGVRWRRKRRRINDACIRRMFMTSPKSLRLIAALARTADTAELNKK